MILSKDKQGNWTPTAGGTGTFIGTLAAFNAIKDTLPVNTVAYITDDASGSSSYSTTETKTGETWIDGKPIYRITFNANLPSNVTQGSVSVEVTGAPGVSNADKVVKGEFLVISREQGYMYTLPRFWTKDMPDSTLFTVIVNANASTENGYLNVEVESNRATWNNESYFCRATVYYTKTTD